MSASLPGSSVPSSLLFSMNAAVFGPISLMMSCGENIRLSARSSCASPCTRLVVGVGAEAEDDAGIPERARVDRLLAGFAAAALAVEDALGPWLAVTECRHVVLVVDAEDRHAEAAARQHLDAGVLATCSRPPRSAIRCAACGPAWWRQPSPPPASPSGSPRAPSHRACASSPRRRRPPASRPAARWRPDRCAP